MSMLKLVSLWALALTIIYVVLMFSVPKQILLIAINGAFLGILFAGIGIYWPVVWDTTNAPKADRVSLLVLGIEIILVSMGLNRIWWLYIQYMGHPESLKNHPILGGVYFIETIGIGLFVGSFGYPPDDKFASKHLFGDNRWIIVISAIAGGLITLLLSNFFKISY